MSTHAEAPAYDCQSCGACCAYSHEWPRFTLEDDAELARIPPQFVDDPRGRMRCDGERCSALTGVVGEFTACSVYTVRPLVCRDCQPGDHACEIARRHHGFPSVSPSALYSPGSF